MQPILLKRPHVCYDIETSFSAKGRPAAVSSPRQVVIVAFDGAQLLDVAGPLQCFATTNDLYRWRGDPRPYGVRVVSLKGGPIATSSGLALLTDPIESVARLPIDTLVCAGGPGTEAAADTPLTAAVRGLALRARRVASVCTGAFLLAAAGLLDGRRAATHWRSCERLAKKYPKLRVEKDPIFVRDGNVWTSAGITAGIDLALALIAEDLGHAAAMATARHLVVFMKRPGGQAQFSAPLAAQTAEDAFAELHAWMRGNLAADLRVESLAERVAISPRHFARVYLAKVGRTPAKMVEEMRIEAARRALEETDFSVKRIARDCGFGDEERMRRSFVRGLGVAPSDYRSRFAAAA
jgi:transcriptional regulator GlxA family with amidase domain